MKWRSVAVIAVLIGITLCPVGVKAGRRFDLNTATVQQMQQVPGIGPGRARAIVQRRSMKPFVRVTELLLIRGIGPRLLAKLRPWFEVGPVGRGVELDDSG